MGRHSIPDPDESSGGTPEGATDATESFDQPLVPSDDAYDQPGYREADYGKSDYESEYDDEYEDQPA